MYIYSDDVNEKLTRYMPNLFGPDDILFYISRRHPLEIVEEFLISLAVMISVVVLSYQFSVSPYFYIPVLLLAYIFPFGLEVFRWNRQIFYLTQYGFYTSWFSFRDFNYHNNSMPFHTGASAIPSTWYRLAGFDVGYFQAVSPDGRRISTPLLPKPFALRKRMDIHRTYRPPQPEASLWSE